ncbi:MAG: hypothetical protein M1574_04335 [Gammaproteobacteria bacterium]|nr:hypothetical protein [Gammaproteobacteria bacterium]
MKAVFYTLVLALVALWVGFFLLRSPGVGAPSGLRVVRMHPPTLRIWTAEEVKRRPMRVGRGSSLATLPSSLVAQPGRTVVLESAHDKHTASHVRAVRAKAATQAPRPPPVKPRPSPIPPLPVVPPPPCWRLVSIVHRSWAVHLAHRFRVSPETIVKRLYDVRLYRVSLILPNAKAAVSTAQRLERLGLPRPYYRHHGGQPELSLGVFLARSAARTLLKRLATDGLKGTLDIFLRPWTTYELLVHDRDVHPTALRRRYPGLRVRACAS